MAQLAAEKADLQAKRDADAAELKALRDKDLSAAELRDQALEEAHRRFEAQKEQTAAERARADQLYEAQRVAFVRSEVSRLINSTGKPPARPDTALREALAENKFTAVDPDNNGNFRLEMSKGDLPVDDLSAEFGGWYEKRSDLHLASGTRLPAPGARTPPAATPKDPTEGMTEAQALRFLTSQYSSTAE